MNNEHEALYSEIKDWQDRRFTVLTAAIGLVTATLGLKIFDQPARTELWPWISAMLLLLLSSACILTWYAGCANAKLAAYLICFHERSSPSGDGWQSRLHRLKSSGMDWLNLNRIVVCIYFVLAAVSVILPVMQHSPSCSGWIVLIVASVIFLWSLLLLASPPPKDHYIKLWEKLPSPQPTSVKRTWGEEKLAFDAWKYYGGVGGADKDTMIKIVTWLLGFSATIIGFYATGKLTEPLATKLLLLLGISVSILAAFTALLYGGYAAWNWAIADRIAEVYEWAEQSPKYYPFSKSKVRWTAVVPLWFAQPCENGLAPVFWLFFVASLISLGVHVLLLFQLVAVSTS